MWLVICNNTKENFSWESEKMNVKFHKNCKNTDKILKMSRVRCHFVYLTFIFSGFAHTLKVLENCGRCWKVLEFQC